MLSQVRSVWLSVWWGLVRWSSAVDGQTDGQGQPVDRTSEPRRSFSNDGNGSVVLYRRPHQCGHSGAVALRCLVGMHVIAARGQLVVGARSGLFAPSSLWSWITRPEPAIGGSPALSRAAR